MGLAALGEERAAQAPDPNSVPAFAALRTQRLLLSGDCVQSRSDAMAIREALMNLSQRLGVKCLTLNALNLANEGVRLGRQIRPEEIGVFASLIMPIAIGSLRTWPALRHFEMDLIATEPVRAEIVTKWARETLGTRVWACEIMR